MVKPNSSGPRHMQGAHIILARSGQATMQPNSKSRASNYLPFLSDVTASNILFGRELRYAPQGCAWSWLIVCFPHGVRFPGTSAGTNGCVCLIWGNEGSFDERVCAHWKQRAPYSEAYSCGADAQASKCLAQLVCQSHRAARRPLRSCRTRVGGALATRSLQQCRGPRAAV
jgi:hypothetical protein